MDKSNPTVSVNMPLSQLILNALDHLDHLEYSRRSIHRYRTTWKHLTEFSRQKNLGNEFSDNLLTQFLNEYLIRDGERAAPKEGWRWHIAFELKVLGDFARNKCIKRRLTYWQKIILPPDMKKPLHDYQIYCNEKLYLRAWTIHRRVIELTFLLDFLSSNKKKTLDQVQAVDLSDFVSSRTHYKPKTVARILSDMRSFFRFLTVRGILQKDLSLTLPTVRVPRDTHIPSVWDRELIVKLLSAIDRSSARGKRDYAILLLACRLGLRVSDIRTLRLNNLDWEGAKITLIQEKTNTPLILPLPEEVGEALIDYLKSGRPETTHREVFLTMNSPFKPFGRGNLYHIINYWRHLAGVSFRTKQCRGLHSLRHSLATQLLREGTPFQTISEILGHTTLESTLIYAKADVEALRSVGLDPQEDCDV